LISTPSQTPHSPIVAKKPVRDYHKHISQEPKSKLKNIIVAQPQPEAAKSPYYELEKKFGIKFDFIPFIKVEGVSTKDFRKQRIVLTDFSGIVFTSRNAIDHFFRMCDELRVKMSQETKFFCTSEAIALYLQKYTQYRKRKVFFSDAGINKELKNLMIKHKETTKFLYICPETRSQDELTSFMSENGIQFVEAVMYKTVPNDLSTMKIANYDMLILFSPTGLSSLLHNFPKFKQGKMKIGIYGRTTADAVIDANLAIHVMAPLNHHTSITSALESYLKDVK
jgi:uroporphyrinogen-III synthase